MRGTARVENKVLWLFYYPTVLHGLIKKEQRGADESRAVTKAVGETQEFSR